MHFASDYTDAFTLKTISSALYMFFATFASTVALGVVIQRNTKANFHHPPGFGQCTVDNYNSVTDDSCTPAYLGVTEYVLMNSIAGMLHSVVGCQPLLVLRPTGYRTHFTPHTFTLHFPAHPTFRLPTTNTTLLRPITQFIILLFTLSKAIFEPVSKEMTLPGPLHAWYRHVDM